MSVAQCSRECSQFVSREPTTKLARLSHERVKLLVSGTVALQLLVMDDLKETRQLLATAVQRLDQFSQTPPVTASIQDTATLAATRPRRLRPSSSYSESE